MRREVLDHGFVELIDVMGDDAEPARAARISYGNTNERAWDLDAKLTKYLWDNQHTTPFEMVELKWAVKAPIFVARQWVRHRTANWNEFSMRYADPTKISNSDQIEYYVPDGWRLPDESNKQGSISATKYDSILGSQADSSYRDACDDSIRVYKELKGLGIANEMARMVLPVSVYTEWIWKNDFKNTLHFLQLRTDEHAQFEIRVYANAMLEIMKERLPRLMEIVWKQQPS